MKNLKFNLYILLSIFIIGCTSRQVSRISADSQIDLSGRWNDTDSRLVAEEITKSLLSHFWINEFQEKNERKPTAIIGTIRNLSSEHIETTTFIKDIERELINSGKVTFVASSSERKEIREERTEQQLEASEETAKKLASETGADFMLKGSFKTLIDAVEGSEIKYYQVDVELVNIETNEKIWMDTKKIKKIVEKNKFKW